MTPQNVYEYAKGLRVKLENIRGKIGYQNYRPLQDVFAASDDLCELVMALAENQKVLADALTAQATVQAESVKEEVKSNG